MRPDKQYGDMSSVVYLAFEYVATIGLHCVATGWNSFLPLKLKNGYLDQYMSPVPPPTQRQAVNGWNSNWNSKRTIPLIDFCKPQRCNAATAPQEVWPYCSYALTDRVISCSRPWLLRQPCSGRWVCPCVLCGVLSWARTVHAAFFFSPSTTVQRINSTSPPCVSCACVRKHLPARVTVHIPPSKCLCFNVVASTRVCHPWL